jgi:predicted MFS family arabinose efflux permease
VQIGTLYLTLVATGLGGGLLAKHARPAQVFALTGLFPLLILASASWAREPAGPAAPRAAGEGLRRLLADRSRWALALLIFLWSFNPLLGTAMFYYQANALKLGPVFIGLMSTVAGLAGVLGAAFFGRRAVSLWGARAIARASVLYGAPLGLLYLFYRGPASAGVLTAFFGFTGVVFRLALMDLAAQACPPGAEAGAFAAYMAVFNLAAWASNAAGGALYDRFLALFASRPDPGWAAASA